VVSVSRPLPTKIKALIIYAEGVLMDFPELAPVMKNVIEMAKEAEVELDETVRAAILTTAKVFRCDTEATTADSQD
jgi:fumarylacetoacetate (FAA) hydrolase family protein